MQRNVHSSAIDGSILAGLDPLFVAPEIDPELDVAHCVTPGALQTGARRRTRRGRRARRLAHLLRRLRGRRGAGRGRSRSRPAADRRRGVGRAPALLRRAAAERARLRRRHGDLLDPQDRRQPDPVGDGPRLRQRPDGRRRRRPGRDAAGVDQPQPTADALARRGEADGGDPRRRARARDARDAAAHPRADPGDRGLDVLEEELEATPGVSAGTRCGFRSTSAAPASPGTASPSCCASTPSSTSSSPPRRSSSPPSAWAARRLHWPSASSTGCAGSSRRSTAASARDAVPFALPPPWGPLEISLREAYFGPQEAIELTSAAGRIAAEALAAYPPGHPERAARRAAEQRDDRVHHRDPRPRRLPPRRQRPNPEDDPRSAE